MAVIKRFPVPPEPAAEPAPRVDGRSLLATGRTVQFATRVHPQWKERLHRIARSRGWMYVEILERSLDALERELAREGREPSPGERPPGTTSFLD